MENWRKLSFNYHPVPTLSVVIIPILSDPCMTFIFIAATPIYPSNPAKEEPAVNPNPAVPSKPQPIPVEKDDELSMLIYRKNQTEKLP